MKRSLYFGLCLSFLLFACTQDDSDDNVQISLNIEAMFGTEGFNLSQVYTTGDGTEIRFDIVKYYMNHVELVHENGSVITLSDVELVDFSKASSQTIQAIIPVGHYTAIKFGLGLDPVWNESDPIDFSPEHPLSSAQNMHWGWAGMYKFALIEGQFDSTNDDMVDKNLAWHSGHNVQYKALNIPMTKVLLDNNNQSINLELDLKEIVDGPANLNLQTEFVSHSSPDNIAITHKVVENFTGAFKVE
jgi:hypothetical protein